MSINLVVLDRPELGDHFQRYALNGLYEQSMVVSIIGPEDHPVQWTAVLLTRNGVEFIGSSAEIRGRFDWVPGAWDYDDMFKTWVNPETHDISDNILFRETDIPSPVEDERYMTWRARVYRDVSGLKSYEGAPQLLKTVWRSRGVAASAK